MWVHVVTRCKQREWPAVADIGHCAAVLGQNVGGRNLGKSVIIAVKMRGLRHRERVGDAW
jgi:hypothetical protein